MIPLGSKGKMEDDTFSNSGPQIYYSSGPRLYEGLYQVTYKNICAGFVVKNGKITECAPVLKKKIDYWVTIAKRVCD